MILELPDDVVLPRPLWAEAVKYRARGRCELCDLAPSDPIAFHAHHLDLNAENHRLDNGQALCWMCHASLHNALRYQVAWDAARAAEAASVERRRYPWLGNSSSEEDQ